MKRFLPLLLALVAAPGHSQSGAWFAFAAMPDTVRSYTNAHGNMQHDAIVLYASDAGSGSLRVGVAGCEDGKGYVGQVDDDGKPVATPEAWRATGTRRADNLALSLCLLGNRAPQAPARSSNGRGMV